MPRFKYKAVESDGTPKEGMIDAESAVWVTSHLRELGYQVNSVEQVDASLGLPHLKQRLSWDDIHIFNEQLLAVTRSDLPLAPALHALARDLRKGRLKSVIEDVRLDIEQGRTIEEALSKHPDCFSPTYLSVIRAGERAGNLPGVLSYLTEHSARMVELKHRIHEALAYPVLAMVVAILVLGLLIVKVVPAFGETFNDFGARLPYMTRFWLAVSESVRTHSGIWITALVGIPFLAVCAYKTFALTPRGRYRIDTLKLALPVLGTAFSVTSTARFSRTLGLLLASRVPVEESLTLAGAASGNARLEAAAGEATVLVRDGYRISDALESTGVFPHNFCWLLANAEERSDDVHGALLGLANSHERSVDLQMKMIRVLLGPALVIIVGGLFVQIIIALYLPIFTLADVMSGM